MIVMVDPVCHNYEHVPFNTGLIAAALQIAPVRFHGEASHIELVRALLPEHLAAKVEWCPTIIPPRRDYSFRRRLTREHRLFKRVLGEAVAANAMALIITTATAPGILAMKTLLLFGRNRVRTLGVFHNGLSAMLLTRSRRAILAFRNTGLFDFIILGRRIAVEAGAMLPSAAPAIRTLTHPIVFGRMDGGPCELDADHQTFAFVGLASNAKGFPEFARLAHDLASDKVSFELIGRLGDDGAAAIRSTGGVGLRIIGEAKAPLPLNIFRERLGAATYGVCLHDPADYRFVCTGSALDAIWAAKPIIALRSNSLQELFDRMGDIGYLCDDLEDLRDTVRRLILQPDPARYRIQSRNITERRHIFGTEAVGAELRAALAAAPPH